MEVRVLKHGTKYRAEHVNRLVAMSDLPVVCYTDDPAGVDCDTVRLPDLPDITGWWWKLYVLSLGPALFLDLDVDVVGPLEAFSELGDGWWSASDPWRSGWNTSVVRAWEDGGVLWDRFLESRPDRRARRFEGDQEWFTEWMGDRVQALPPDWCVSYKHHVLGQRNPAGPRPVPRGCLVVYYHGQPKPWDLPHPT